ncbi:MAG: bifunctional 2-polyprenyl-6-hydroxyphenol methylase/3-demethylubiquinol 3-O-methyltransferase UbiG [Xanthobacteraceae bacterium]|nr:bifunctional 2-polyprenyl-6-hydroxyphenol methylase/3-demethylubiquinol 3-O-methyltransferase UbiG [Xanthobacteraceae bacterium]QYK44713.1 MAG: bifunctional 2-polyprenyl-6-hydroxyphenol methylase/3-demethylubiquinol 3-O-methyltransferase UbiG [Xanthobacteraceae bacterium]HMN51061.1 bifunctional 2-polyprenyl-6-hydroxyphenol methylase/3-demethylubiquinol 3-O-methyltransferase UbiG [Xanthobacteraceae bacterium]
MVDAQRKQESTIDPGEVSRFAAMAKEWWAPHGKMRPLHKLNPVRIAFIRDLACDIFDRSPRKLDCLRGLRILDIGCGGGILSEPLARLGGEVVGIDPAEENVEVAKVHAEQSALEIDYRATSAETLADAGEKFDIVIASEVVEHVADLPLFMKRACEMVKPGGFMAITTINRTLRSFALAIVGAEYILRWLPVGTHTWDKFVMPEELAGAFAANGMDECDRGGMIFNPLTGEWRRGFDTAVNYMIAGRKPA